VNGPSRFHPLRPRVPIGAVGESFVQSGNGAVDGQLPSDVQIEPGSKGFRVFAHQKIVGAI